MVLVVGGGGLWWFVLVSGSDTAATDGLHAATDGLHAATVCLFAATFRCLISATEAVKKQPQLAEQEK